MLCRMKGQRGQSKINNEVKLVLKFFDEYLSSFQCIQFYMNAPFSRQSESVQQNVVTLVSNSMEVALITENMTLF